MRLSILLVLQTAVLLNRDARGQINRPWTDRDCQRMTRACDRITRGVEGSPGSKGAPGARGSQGPVGLTGDKGARGPPGRAIPGRPGQRPSPPGQPPGPLSRPGPPGDPGGRGVTGMPGDVGDPGKPGRKGRKGYQGFPGNKGVEGEDGDTGFPGPRGYDGPPGSQGRWWRCTWVINRDKDNGLIKECIFNKRDSNSVLHVAYEGNLQVGLCENCCKRWYFIFNDVECTSPTTIDAVMSGGLSLDYPFHSSGRIEGICETRFPAGVVRVGLQMENCPTFSTAPVPHNVQLNNRYGKILIREVSPPQ